MAMYLNSFIQIIKRSTFYAMFITLLFLVNNSYGQKNFEGVITFKIEGQTNAPQKMIYYVKGNKVRMEMDMAGMASNMSPTIIFDNGTNKMYTLISQMNSYMEIPINMDEMDDNNDSTGEDEKPQKTGKTEKIAGVECQQWLIKTDEGETELWNAKGFGNFLFVDNNAFMKRKKNRPQWVQDIMKEGFFPFRIINKDKSGKIEMKMEVTNVERKNLQASLFAIPSNYKKMNIPSR